MEQTFRACQFRPITEKEAQGLAEIAMHDALMALGMGFTADAIARWRDLPDPPKAALEAETEELDWRSSA